MSNNLPDFKKRREELLLTQEEVADAMKVSVRTVANWDVGEGPAKKKAVEIEKYFADIAGKRAHGAGPKNIVPDRGFILEVQIRNVLWQIAKDRARFAGHPENWKKYLEEIDADTSEVMKDLLEKREALGQ